MKSRCELCFCDLRENMSKKNIILGGVFIFLIIVAWLYVGPIKNWQKNSSKTENFLAPLQVDNIERIEIKSGGQTTILEKQGERLKVGGFKDFYVDATTANSLIESLRDAIIAETELVSRNKDKKADFQTDEASGSRVKLFQGEKVLADFVVGKMTSDYSGSYISPFESDKTFSVNVNLNSVSRPDWRDNKIFASNKEQINKIRFQYPTREFTVEKSTDNKWAGSLPYKFEVAEEKISKILDIMSNLSAAQIPDQDFSKSGLENHPIIVQATGEGIDNILMIGNEFESDKNLFYAKKGDSDNIYLITKIERDELNKQIGGLK